MVRASRHIRRLVAGLASLLIVVLMVIPTMAAAKPAYAVDLACEVTGSYNNIGPETPGSGDQGLLPRLMLWRNNPGYVIDGNVSLADLPGAASNYTLWELNGTDGLLWSTSGKDVDNHDSCSVWSTTLSQVAQIIFEVPRFVVSITNSLQEMAVANRPVTPLLDRLDGGHTSNQGVVSQVFKWVTLPGAAVALAATGIWILVRVGGRRQQESQSRDREIVDGVLWAVVATGMVLFLLIGNTWRSYLDAGDRAVASFNSAISSALLPNIGATGPCALPVGKTVPDGPGGSSQPVLNRGPRVAICNFYKTFAFQPWARGQFGSAGGSQLPAPCLGNKGVSQAILRDDSKAYLSPRVWDIRIFQVESQSYSLNDWRRVQANDHAARKYPPGSGAQYSPWADVQSHMQGHAGCSGLNPQQSKQFNADETELSALYSDWQGNNGFGRIGIALSDALLCLLCALPPLLASMLAFMFQILAWLAIFALPIVGVAGIFPPFRRWLTSLLQILLASYFARFAFGVALTMTQLAYGIVFSSPFPFGVQILILLVIVVAAMHLIRAVRDAGLTSSWSRAMHGTASSMAGTAGRRAARVGGTVLAGAAGGATAMVLEERRTRRNTVDRPIGREETPAQAGEPGVAPRRRSGVVIAADGTTSPADPTSRNRQQSQQSQQSQDGPQVARRLRRADDTEPVDTGATNTGTRNTGTRNTGTRNAGTRNNARSNSEPAVVGQPIRAERVSGPTRRQNGTREPTNNPEPPVQENQPPTRRQGDRARFVDPEP